MRYIILLALFLTVDSCLSTAPQQQASQLSISYCHAQNGLPDPRCTAGAVFANIAAAQVCKAGYAQSVRNVPQNEKDKVFAEYGVTTHATGEYEVDHLVSLELGGSNEIANLWPESATPKPGFHEKDKVENYLHNQVCSGKTALKDAQTEIATNWKAIVVK